MDKNRSPHLVKEYLSEYFPQLKKWDGHMGDYWYYKNIQIEYVYDKFWIWRGLKKFGPIFISDPDCNVKIKEFLDETGRVL